MNLKIIAIVFVLGAMPLFLAAQQNKGFEITGHLEGLTNGEVVRLRSFFNDSSNSTLLDSCKSINGEFHLKGITPDGPRLYIIGFRGHSHLIPGSGKAIGGIIMTLLIDNGEKITIHGGDINKLDGDFEDEVFVDGSPSNFAKASLERLYDPFYHLYHLRISPRLKEIKDSIGFDRSLVQGLLEAKTMLDKELGGALVTAPVYCKPAIPWFIHNFITNPVLDYHGFFLKDLYESLDEPDRNSYYGKILKSNMGLAVGQVLPGFTLPTLDGKMIALSDMVAKSKVTLVWLWASNSYIRNEYEQELLPLYKKYHDKGLNIIGVSADKSADDLAFFLHQKQYPWVNVSDLKGNMKGSIVFDLYNQGGHAVPNTTNILLDEKGRIIAWDPTGVELQWYLWKYLGD
jgi:peroxiredoxin